MFYLSLEEINVIVSNLENQEEIIKILKLKEPIKDELHFVKLKWLTDSNKQGSLCDLNKYLINQTKQIIVSKSPVIETFTLLNYECQRLTPINHLNENLTVCVVFFLKYFVCINLFFLQ